MTLDHQIKKDLETIARVEGVEWRVKDQTAMNYINKLKPWQAPAQMRSIYVKYYFSKKMEQKYENQEE